jgi:peptidoglycan/LPS O-acetylase OafA/YrhL
MLVAKNKLAYIEGVRGLAAIIVVLHHYILAFYPAMSSGMESQIHNQTSYFEEVMAQSPLNILYNGSFAVCIFFILSGFVLSNNYHQHNNPRILVEYTIKRYFRLLIPVAGSVIIAYVFVNLGFMNHTDLGAATLSREWLSSSFDITADFGKLIKNLFVDVFLFKNNTYNAVLWTMTYELLGSFLIFSFLFITHPIKYKYICLAFLLAVLFGLKQYYYAAFVLGVLLNKYVVQNQESQSKNQVSNWILWIIFLVGLFFSSFPYYYDIQKTIYSCITVTSIKNIEFYHVIGAFMILFVVLNSHRIQSLLSGNKLSFIGKISFSFYLLHFIILCSLSCYLFKVFYQWYEYNSAVILAFLCSLPVIVGSSIIYYQWIDKTGIKFSEKILRFFYPKTERL